MSDFEKDSKERKIRIFEYIRKILYECYEYDVDTPEEIFQKEKEGIQVSRFYYIWQYCLESFIIGKYESEVECSHLIPQCQNPVLWNQFNKKV